MAQYNYDTMMISERDRLRHLERQFDRHQRDQMRGLGQGETRAQPKTPKQENLLLLLEEVL